MRNSSCCTQIPSTRATSSNPSIQTSHFSTNCTTSFVYSKIQKYRKTKKICAPSINVPATLLLETPKQSHALHQHSKDRSPRPSSPNPPPHSLRPKKPLKFPTAATNLPKPPTPHENTFSRQIIQKEKKPTPSTLPTPQTPPKSPKLLQNPSNDSQH